MPINPANASELATIAREVGAEVLEGNLRYPSATGGWQLGDVDLGEYLERYRDQRLKVILAVDAETGQPVTADVYVDDDHVGEDVSRVDLTVNLATDRLPPGPVKLADLQGMAVRTHPDLAPLL
jgi:hypothetical protein